MRTFALTFGLLLTAAVALAADSESRFGAKLEKPSETLADQLGLPKGQGIVISKIKADSLAAKAGLQANDILLEINGKTVPNDMAELNKMLDNVKADAKVDALVLRKGKKELVKDVTLPEGKKEEKRPAIGKRPGLPNRDPNKTVDNLKKALEGLGQGAFPGANPDDIKKLMDQLGGGKKIDPEQLKKLMEKLGGGLGGGDGAPGFDPEQLKGLLEKFGGGGGLPNVDPEQLKGLLEKFGGGGGAGVDPEQLKKMLEKFGGAGGLGKGKGGVNPDQLKKMLEKFGGGGGGQGGFDPEQLKGLLEKFGGGGQGGLDADKLRELLQKKGATPKLEEKKDAEPKKKQIDVRFEMPMPTCDVQLCGIASFQRFVRREA